MKVFVLVISIFCGRGDGMATSVTTQEFASVDSCKAAAKIVQSRGNVVLGVFVNADCVEK